MTETSTATDSRILIDRYLEFWNATPEDQVRLAPDTFADEIRYVTPVGLMSGAEALVEFKRQLTEHVGAVRFVAREQPQSHHNVARLPWEVLTADGESFAAGTDVIEYDDHGMVRAVSGFLDRAPEEFDHHED